MASDNPELPSSSNLRIVTRKYLFDKMQQQDLPSLDAKLEYLQRDFLACEGYSDEQIQDIKHKFSHIRAQFKQRWLKAHKKSDIFVKDNEQWLRGTFSIPKVLPQCKPGPGRPQKTFSECSERSKRRKTEELRSAVESDVLVHATQVSLQVSGHREASHILKEVAQTPTRALHYKTAFRESLQDKDTQLTPLRALSMFVEADLSQRQYEIVRSTNKKYYPSYSVLQRAKKECYPCEKAYQVTDTCAELNVQDLLDHTVTRLLTYLEEVLNGLDHEECRNLMLLCKWGCDGSQQTQFKQKIQNDATDANIFQSCFVPLQLVSGTSKQRILWQNPTPSSPRYCRPIRIRFIKESADIITEEITYIEDAISKLHNSECTLGDRSYSVNHKMQLTMVDGKVCNAATHTSSTMRCYICGATGRQLNDLTIKRDVNVEALGFGLSVLHARIRLFESILHLSYKLSVKKWQVRDATDKAIIKQRKADIQAAFRRQTGLIVDVPKAGLGNTNDGNTSRRVFTSPQLAAEITGVSFELIFRKVILEVISSGHKVNLRKFADYGMETARLYIELYPWQPMTPTLHKILVHGATVMEHALLPIGLLSEEAAEARNKHFRLYRQSFARKFSREACNLDVLNRLLLSSDPLLSGMRPKSKKKTKPYLQETVDMLLPAEPIAVADTDSEESEEEVEEASDEES